MELEEEKSLLSEPAVCREAREILINPRKRIAAEIAWMPGVDPRFSAEVLTLLQTPARTIPTITGLTHIARVNLLVSALSRLPHLASSDLIEWIVTIAKTYEIIQPEGVQAILNADRATSNFPEITDQLAIADEIRKQKTYYRQCLTAVLEKRHIREQAKILIQTIELATNDHEFRAPVLIEELVLSYELRVQEDMAEQREIINTQDKKLRAMVDAQAPNTKLQPVVNALIQDVKAWNTVVQPIQLIKRDRGEQDTVSLEVAWAMRHLAIALFNDYNKPDLSRQILKMLLQVFAEVPEIVEHITEDLKELEKQAALSKNFEKVKDITELVTKIQKAADTRAPDHTLLPMVLDLIQDIRTWNPSIQPTEADQIVAGAGRHIALHLWNEHRKLDFAIQITTALHTVFALIPEVGYRFHQDLSTLKEMKLQQNSQETEEQRTGCLWLVVILVIIGVIVALLQGC